MMIVNFVSKLVLMSFQASHLIIAVIMLKYLFKRRISPQLNYALWILPAVRLLIPYSFNFFKTYTESGVSAGINRITYQLSNNAITDSMNSFNITVYTLFANTDSIINGTTGLDIMVFIIWLAGLIILLAYMLVANIIFNYLTKNSAQIIDTSKALPVYLMKNIKSPCLYGILRPKILVNEAALENNQIYDSVCSHELAHYKSGDQIWTLIRYTCCLIHWFNPLIWLAARYAKNDCELACDFIVTKDYTKEQREQYGLALIHIVSFGNIENAINQKAVQMGSEISFIKKRITYIGINPKSYRSVSVLSLLAAIILFVVCGFSNQGLKKDLFSSHYLAKTIINASSDPPVNTMALKNGTIINEYLIEGCDDSLFISANPDLSLLFEYYETDNNIFYSRKIEACDLEAHNVLSILSKDRFEIIFVS